MTRPSISVLIAAKNEAVNIAKCLTSVLGRAQRVIVVDSHSIDATASVAASLGAEVVQFSYTGGYPKKRQWALDSFGLVTDWVLLLDADEVVPESLWAEIAAATQQPDAPTGFLITKGFHFLGKRFHFGGFSFSALLLFRTGKARFEELVVDPANALDMEVHERIVVDGTTASLPTPLIHDDFKGLEAYIDRHNKYSTWEAKLRHQFLTTGRYGTTTVQAKLFGNAQERRRWLKKLAIRVPFEPLLWFMYHYFFKLGILEGRRGLIACQIRAHYIAQVRAKMYELSLNRSTQ